MQKLTTAYIGLGSNLGNREDSIRNAIKMLAEAKHIEVAHVSDIIKTTPLGDGNQPDYLNAVAEIKTTLSAEDFHRKLSDVETSLGRVREEKWSPRIIDLDLLLFGRQIINHPDLTVPHPQMHLRFFVLKGLCQFAPGLLHPVIKESMSELTARLGGNDFVLNPDVPQLVSVAGVIGVGKTTLTKKLSNSLGCRLILESYDTNPFMPDVYAGKKELALDSQLYFLTSRIQQLSPNILTQGQIAISDYIFNKEFFYARRLLNAQQLALYEQICAARLDGCCTRAGDIFAGFRGKMHGRIHKRDRPYEQKIKLQFLEALSADYEQLFADWKLSPVIRISMSELDCTRDGDIERLAGQIKSYVAV